MKIQIHEDAQAAFNEEGFGLLPLILTSNEEPPVDNADGTRFYPVAELNRDDISNYAEFMRVPGVGIVSKRKQVGALFHGFNEEGYRALRLLAEKIQRLKGVREKVSKTAMEEAVFDWTIDRHLGGTDQPLCQRLIEEFESRIKERWMWAAIFGIHGGLAVELGRTTIYPFQADFFKKWESVLRKRNAWDDDRTQAFVKMVRSKLQGHLACTMKIVAEPTRAREIVLEEAESTCAILRLYLPSMVHPLVPSYCRPWVYQEVAFNTVLVIEDDEVVNYNVGNAEVETWAINDSILHDAQQLGLGLLHEIYLRDKKTEFEKDLLRSLFTFSRSSLQKDPSDRLVYVFRALDSFLLQNRTENIQQNIAERIAFTVSDDAKRRQEVVDLIKKAYGLRSDIVHHDQSIEETDLIGEFLQTVHFFFVWLLLRHKDYPSRKEFFEAVEAKKYA